MNEEFFKQWKRIEDDLGMNDDSMRRGRPYLGQPHTDTGERGKTEVHGVTFRDLRDCYIRACCLSDGITNPAQYNESELGEYALLCENDIYTLDWENIDPMAVFQNFSCEVEKLMGIYPNIKQPEEPHE